MPSVFKPAQQQALEYAFAAIDMHWSPERDQGEHAWLARACENVGTLIHNTIAPVEQQPSEDHHALAHSVTTSAVCHLAFVALHPEFDTSSASAEPVQRVYEDMLAQDIRITRERTPRPFALAAEMADLLGSLGTLTVILTDRPEHGEPGYEHDSTVASVHHQLSVISFMYAVFEIERAERTARRVAQS